MHTSNAPTFTVDGGSGTCCSQNLSVDGNLYCNYDVQPSRRDEINETNDKHFTYKTILYGVEASDISAKKKVGQKNQPMELLIEVDEEALVDNEFINEFSKTFQFTKGIYNGEFSVEFKDNVLTVVAYKHGHQQYEDVEVFT